MEILYYIILPGLGGYCIAQVICYFYFRNKIPTIKPYEPNTEISDELDRMLKEAKEDEANQG